MSSFTISYIASENNFNGWYTWFFKIWLVQHACISSHLCLCLIIRTNNMALSLKKLNKQLIILRTSDDLIIYDLELFPSRNISLITIHLGKECMFVTRGKRRNVYFQDFHCTPRESESRESTVSPLFQDVRLFSWPLSCGGCVRWPIAYCFRYFHDEIQKPEYDYY